MVSKWDSAQYRHFRRKAKERQKKNRCGKCSACCLSIGVRDAKSGLDKAEWVACPHLRDHGCGIYPTRPDVCKCWCCIWKTFSDEAELRPDRCGLLLSIQPDRLMCDSVYADNRALRDQQQFLSIIDRISKPFPKEFPVQVNAYGCESKKVPYPGLVIDDRPIAFNFGLMVDTESVRLMPQ